LGVTRKSLPVFSLGNDTTICDNTKINLTGPSNMVSYLWNGGEGTKQTFSTSEEKTHTLAVVDKFGCKFSDSKIIFNNPSSKFSLGRDTLICKGINYTIFGPGFLTNFFWNGITSFSANKTINTPGTYILQASNSFGCIHIDTIVIGQKQDPIFSLGPNGGVCANGGRTLKGPANQKYLWNDGDTNGVKPIVKNGIYIAKTNLEGCLNSDTVEYKFYKYPFAELGNDTTICFGKTIELLPTIEKDVLFKWSNSDTTSSITVDTKGEYIVDVVRNLCITSDTVYVDTEVCIPCRAYVPNAFTPNKDGKNDRYQVVFRDDKDCKLKVFQLQIFNRWGELIFETNDIKTEWIPPMLVTDNVYGYVLKYSFQDRGIYNTVYDMGSITLMK
jgi:gliding motility-associated-like protein